MSTRIWGKKFDRKTFTIICEVKLNGNWWHCSSTTRCRMPFLKGIAKGANLTPCQTNQLYTGKVSIPLRHPCVSVVLQQPFKWSETSSVSGFLWYKSVLPGVCTDQIHHTLSWHLKEKTTAMWSEIGVKLEAWSLIQNKAVRCHKWHTLSRNQSFKDGLLARRQKKCSACVHYMGKR